MGIEDYIKSIAGSDVLLKKVKEVKKLGDAICPDKIEDFFVTEYRKPDNERVYQSLFLFSKRYLLESKNILSSETKIDIAFYFEYVDYFEITSNGYDFRKASENSTLELEGTIGSIVFDLKASGKNCDKLWTLTKKYIKPNLYSEIAFEETVEE